MKLFGARKARLQPLFDPKNLSSCKDGVAFKNQNILGLPPSIKNLGHLRHLLRIGLC